METISHAFGQFSHAVAVAFEIFLGTIVFISAFLSHLFTKWYYKWKIRKLQGK